MLRERGCDIVDLPSGQVLPLEELLEDEEINVELAEETLERAARVWAQEHD